MYRVVVNKEGLLVWAKDGTHLDTSKYHEDRGPEHGGIVEISEEEYAERRKKEDEKLKEMQDRGEVDSDLSRSSSSSSSSSDEADEIREGVHPYSDKVGSLSLPLLRPCRPSLYTRRLWTATDALGLHAGRHGRAGQGDPAG